MLINDHGIAGSPFADKRLPFKKITTGMAGVDQVYLVLLNFIDI